MKRIFLALATVALMAGLTPASAAGMHGGALHGIRGFRAEPLPRVPDLQSRIPAPLPPPAAPPVINGPVGPSGLPPMGNGL
jgi:hypothetical protein